MKLPRPAEPGGGAAGALAADDSPPPSTELSAVEEEDDESCPLIERRPGVALDGPCPLCAGTLAGRDPSR